MNDLISGVIEEIGKIPISSQKDEALDFVKSELLTDNQEIISIEDKHA